MRATSADVHGLAIRGEEDEEEEAGSSVAEDDDEDEEEEDEDGSDRSWISRCNCSAGIR